MLFEPPPLPTTTFVVAQEPTTKPLASPVEDLSGGSRLSQETWRTSPVISGTGVPTVGFSQNSWVTPNFNGNAISLAITSDPSSADKVSLRAQMDRAQMEQIDERTQAGLQALSRKVELLARAVEAMARPVSHFQSETSAPAVVTAEVLNAALETGKLSDLLNFIADELPDTPADLLDVVQSALRDPDPVLRAAAGRALSAAYPDRALELLPGAIAEERNRFVASALQGALDAAFA